jgi:hypothetical protein
VTTTTITATARRRSLRLLLATAIVTITAAGSAWAHGDPASHYLETDSLYPSFASQPSQQVQLQLLGLLQATERRGYPIKVALVAGEADLVEDLAMLRTPQRYAGFVASAIGSKLQAPVLIVTPYGLGVAGNARRDGRLRPITAGDAQALVGGTAAPAQAEGDALARTAMTAIRRIARAGGHPLPARVPPAEMYTPPAAAPAPAPTSEPAATADASGGTGGMLMALPVVLVLLAFLTAYLRGRGRQRHSPVAFTGPERG